MKTQRYRAYWLTDERLPQLIEVGVGGFVILPDGKIIPVGDCHHWAVVEKHFGNDWHRCFREGAVRVSHCGPKDRCYVEWWESCTTLSALQTLRRLMRYEATTGRNSFRTDDPGIDRHLTPLSLKQAVAEVNRLITARMTTLRDERAAA